MKARDARKKAFAEVRPSAASATEQLKKFVRDCDDPLQLRRSFSYLRSPIVNNSVSDRSAPQRTLRPPATRLITSRGMALRFVLTVLAVEQQSRVTRRLPIETKNASESGWTDLVASPSRNSRATAGFYEKAKTKRRKQIKSALENLEDAGLVELGQGMRKFEDFAPLDEGGRIGRAGHSLLPYRRPGRREDVFELPGGFFENGWVHVLQDSEIALILMVKCGVGSLPDSDPEVKAIGSYTRLHHYGFGRDSFSAALLPLEELGLLHIDRPERNPTGTHEGHAEGEKVPLYRLRILDSGFEANAIDVADEVYSN